MSTPLPVAVIGAGHMGRHHVRKYHEMDSTELVAVIDQDVERARALAEPLGVRYAPAWSPDLGEIAAATIAVPTVNHLAVARPLIEAGIAVLIEKPLAPTGHEADQIAALAAEHGVTVAVGHTERFNPAVQAVLRLNLMPKFIETHRISPFTFRSADVSVVFDMMIHDIDIVLHLMRHERVKSADAYGVNVLAPSEDVTNARVVFDQGGVANLTASRLALKTERKLRVFCHNAYLSLDYQKRSGIAIALDKNLDVLKLARERKVEDLAELAGTDFGSLVNVEPLEIQEGDALNAELEQFIEAVRTKTPPAVPVEDGVAAVKLAEAIVTSARGHAWGTDVAADAP
jgi:predicted dehydrogenase